MLLITTRLMVAYDISDGALTSGCQSSPVKPPTVWKCLPERISFGRILHVLHESAIVTLYEGKIKFVYPELDDPEPNAKTIAIYNVCNCLSFSRRKRASTDVAVLSFHPQDRIVPIARRS